MKERTLQNPKTMMNKNQLFLDNFFNETLTDEQKEEFIQKSVSDPDFLREFVRQIELEASLDELLNL